MQNQDQYFYFNKEMKDGQTFSFYFFVILCAIVKTSRYSQYLTN